MHNGVSVRNLFLSLIMETLSPIILLLCCTVSTVLARDENILSLKPEPPLENGLSWTFYKTACPELESIVKQRVDFYLKQDITEAAGLLRLHFHDCFVQGCDASVLLEGSADGPTSEKQALPNLTLRPNAYEIINDIKERVDKACGVLVSCADIISLAVRDPIRGAGGPEYRVPLGRRVSLGFASEEVTIASLPPPTSKVSALINFFSSNRLDNTDVVALSGGHSLGIGHCSSFTDRLYPKQDATLNKSFVKNLYGTCPASNSTNTTVLDIRTPNVFDNKYYVDLMNRQGLFTSDQDLYTDSLTKNIVRDFAVDEDLFFQKFALAMAKMSQLSVLTGSKGEIRRNCWARNPAISSNAIVSDAVIDSPALDVY